MRPGRVEKLGGAASRTTFGERGARRLRVVLAGRGDGCGRTLMSVAHVSASFSAILRIRLDDQAGTFGRVATAIGAEGALLDAIDLVRIEKTHKVRDVTILAEDEAHIE